MENLIVIKTDIRDIEAVIKIKDIVDATKAAVIILPKECEFELYRITDKEATPK